MIKSVCVIGLGYIGLPTAALLANCGYDVRGVDIVQNTVDTINAGKIHIVEPELEIYVKKAVDEGKLRAFTKPDQADIYIIAVPTPFSHGFVPDISFVEAAAAEIADYVCDGSVVVLESTSPVGTTERVEEVLREHGVDTSTMHFGHCPERVLPGKIMRELVDNDRIVGGTTKNATTIIADFYRTFVKGEVLETDARTAEMTKLTENSFRDTNIAFANELSMLCEKFKINVWELIKLANHHPRVNILQPGAGVGGHCIAVDPWFIVHAGGETAKLIKTSREVNLSKTEWVIDKIKNKSAQFEQQTGRPAKVACMGLAFKPNIDDLRESPALYITKRLMAENMDILAVEPNVKSYKEFALTDYKKAAQDADIVVFLVAHNEFKLLEIEGALDFCGIFQ